MVPEWTSSQRRTATGAVESEQRIRTGEPVVAPTPEGARRLGAEYWSALADFTGTLVRPHVAPDGSVDLRLGPGPALLRFGAPEVAADNGSVSCRYPIRGGFLARRRVGAITFAQEALGSGVEIRSTITDFYPSLAARPGRPRWTGALYAQGQARLHVALSRRYFARLLEHSE